MKGARIPFSSSLKSSRAVKAFFFFLILFLLVFPKGGIKIKEAPLTWGYIFISVIGLGCAIRRSFLVPDLKMYALFCAVPFALWGWFSICFFGTSNVAFAISFVVSFLALPFIFLFCFSEFFKKIHWNLLEKWILRALFFVSLFGVIAFFYQLFFLDFFLIPYLMLPAEDIAEFALTKMIDRGGVFKLVSTYNNGNIYGICMLMFFNYYFFCEKSIVKKGVFFLSLILTLSRTVWIGVLLASIIGLFQNRFNRFSILKLFLLLAVLISLIGFAVFLMQKDIAFIFDADLGGRAFQLDVLQDITLFPKEEFEPIWEIVYLGVLKNFGLIGLFLFLIAMCAPLFLFFFRKRYVNHLKGIHQLAYGLCLYLILCCADGAVQVIPTMAFFWFITALTLSFQEQTVLVEPCL